MAPFTRFGMALMTPCPKILAFGLSWFLRMASLGFISAWMLPTSDAQGIDPTLKLALQRNYSNWKRAMISKDLRGWQANTCRYRQTMTRNLIVSRKMNWPRSLFAVPIQPPETALLKLVEAAAANDVGRLTYFGRVDFRVSDQPLPNSILMLYFRKEHSEWKFDRTRYFNLKGNQRVKGMAENGNFIFLSEPEFKLNGKAAPVPPFCPSPLYVGQLRIISSGYRTTVQFNAFHHTVIDDTVANQVIIGGLRKGPNKLKLKVEGTDGTDPKKTSPDRQLEVSVFVTSKDKKRPAVRVFHLDPGDKVKSEYDLTVWATAVTLRRQ